jgi:hypothetical protein
LGVFFEGQRQRAEKMISPIDAQHAIQRMGECNGVSGGAARAGQGRQRDRVGAQGHGVVGSDDALIAQAEAAGEIEAAGQGADGAGDSGGGVGEALVGVGTELGEHGVGLRQGGGAGEAQFADPAVLEGAPGAFDAARGLGRVGGDLLDAEFF